METQTAKMMTMASVKAMMPPVDHGFLLSVGDGLVLFVVFVEEVSLIAVVRAMSWGNAKGEGAMFCYGKSFG